MKYTKKAYLLTVKVSFRRMNYNECNRDSRNTLTLLMWHAIMLFQK